MPVLRLETGSEGAILNLMQWDSRHSSLLPALVVSLGIAPALFLRPLPIAQQVESIDLRQVVTGFDSLLRENLSRNVSALMPVSVRDATPGAYLDPDGIILWTNFQRREEGPLPPLQESLLLKEVAQQRLTDMFDQQYFAHFSPEGYGAKDVAQNLGYDYLQLGENIALGVFKNDQAVVQAWMDSKPHRENILNTRFREIGVAAGVGKYEGRYAWIGVQIFGLPLSACPPVDPDVKQVIIAEKVQMLRLQKAADLLRSELESMSINSEAAVDQYAKKARIYNVFVDRINFRAAEVNRLVKEYNRQVEAFNGC